MAAMKKANIVLLVAAIVIVFSVTIHGFPDGNAGSSLTKGAQKSKAEAESGNVGDENKPSDETVADEKGSDKPASNTDSEKKAEGAAGAHKANTDKETDASTDKVTDQADKKSISNEKPADKSEKGDKKE